MSLSCLEPRTLTKIHLKPYLPYPVSAHGAAVSAIATRQIAAQTRLKTVLKM